jgi:ribonuclease HI
MGTLRSSPTDLIDAHAGLLPMELTLRKACHRAMIHSLSLPDSHPLHKIIKRAKRHPPEKNLGPLDQLLKIFKLRNTTFEYIDSANQNVAGIVIPRIKTVIAPNREASISFERNDKADFKDFSDGSGQEEGIGASAILYKKGFIRPVKDIQAYLSHKSKHNTYEAEATGTILALWLIRNTPETIGKTVSIYIDNQAIVMALTSDGHSSGQYLIRTLKMAANGLLCNVTFRWISSHSEVKGNEVADKIAKMAAQGCSSRREDLPHLL